jgi:hypothetical protein
MMYVQIPRTGFRELTVVQLGIHLPPSAVAGSSKLSAEEKGVRERVFWSAMIWDK